MLDRAIDKVYSEAVEAYVKTGKIEEGNLASLACVLADPRPWSEREKEHTEALRVISDLSLGELIKTLDLTREIASPLKAALTKE